ncbi:MAG: ABC transporter substrate-binding protein [Cohaesibacteraceae bacterium]|nr:ABC transporter substrate-binding protein [Cohaesibacteraceae bacterium]
MIRLVLALLVLIFLSSLSRATEPGTLNILSATDTKAIKSLIRKFELLNPDIHITYQEFDANELFETIRKHRDDPSYPVDIVISSAMDLQVKLVNEGMARPHNLVGAIDIEDWAQWRNELYGFTFEPLVLAYNKSMFPEAMHPKTRSDLASIMRDFPVFFNNRIGTYDIRDAGSGYLFATQDAIQSNQIFRLMESFGRANPRTYCCTSDILDDIARGKLILGYNLIGSYALARARQNPDIGVLMFNDYTIVMARTAFIHRDAAHVSHAKRFLDFLLSNAGQEAIAKNSDLIPILREYRTALAPFEDTSPFLPIHLGVGLLTYQDKLKKRNFLTNWEASFLPKKLLLPQWNNQLRTKSVDSN